MRRKCNECGLCGCECFGACCRPCKHLGDNPMLLIRAAATLPVRPISVEELTVTAWRMRPDRFGLKGYPEHADVGRVRNLLYGGRTNLVKRGIFKPAGEGTLLLAQFARLAAERRDVRLLAAG